MSTVDVVDSVVQDNVAQCARCSGGGIFLTSGGLLTVAGSVVEGNSVGYFGGGIAVGDTEDTVLDTCALRLWNGTAVAGNVAGVGVAQVCMDCSSTVCAGWLSRRHVCTFWAFHTYTLRGSHLCVPMVRSSHPNTCVALIGCAHPGVVCLPWRRVCQREHI